MLYRSEQEQEELLQAAVSITSTLMWKLLLLLQQRLHTSAFTTTSRVSTSYISLAILNATTASTTGAATTTYKLC